MKIFIYLAFLSFCLWNCQSTSQENESQAQGTQTEASLAVSTPQGQKPPVAAPEGMVWIPAGQFEMGSNGSEANPSEGPAHPVEVNGFFIDETEVTNAEFVKFVKATGYKTVAEQPIDWDLIKKDLPEGTPKPHDSILQPGSLVFVAPKGAVPLDNYSYWWKWQVGANWRHPQGPGSDIKGKDDYPVVHIAYEDALAYAEWAGKRLPTEAEWEYAASVDADGKAFAWGDELTPSGKYLANFFQGNFPYQNLSSDGYEHAAPVHSYPANPYDLHDMIGNVWEWTTDWYRPDTYKKRHQQGIALCKNPEGPDSSFDPQEPYAISKRVIKGGSFLCSEQYCSNYRPSARMASSVDSGQEHLGFRCVATAEMAQRGVK